MIGSWLETHLRVRTNAEGFVFDCPQRHSAHCSEGGRSGAESAERYTRMGYRCWARKLLKKAAKKVRTTEAKARCG
jgi:hypothetical protein